MADRTITLRLVVESGQATAGVDATSASLSRFRQEVDKATGGLSRFAQEFDKLGRVGHAAAASALDIGAAVKAIDMLVDAATRAADALFDAVRGQISYAARVGDIAQRMAMSTEALSALASRARTTGSDLDAVTSAIDTLGDRAYGAARGGKQFAAAFAAMGLAVRDAATGALRPTGDLLEDAARKLASYKDGAAKTALATRIFGEKAKELLPTLSELGAVGLQGVIDKARETGAVIGGHTAAQAQVFEAQMATLREQLRGLFAQIARDVLPTLVELSRMFGEVTRRTSEMGAEQSSLTRIMEISAGAMLITKNVADGLGLTAIALYDSAVAAGIALADMVTAPARLAAAAVGGIEGIRAELARMRGNLSDFATTTSDAASVLKAGWGDVGTRITEGLDRINSASTKAAAAIGGVRDASSGAEAPITVFGNAMEAAARKAAAAATALASAQKRWDDELDSLRGNLSAVDRAQSNFDKGMRAVAAHAEELAIAGGNVNEIIQQWQEKEALLRAAFARTNVELAKRNPLTSGNKDIAEQLAQQRDRLSGLKDAQTAYNAAVRSANQLAEDALLLGKEEAEVQQGLGERLRMLAELRDNAVLEDAIGQYGDLDPFTRLTDSINVMQDALAKASAAGVKDLSRLERAIGNARQAALVYATDALGRGIASLQTMTREGSRAYAALEAAQTGLNLVTAIGAIVNQGLGDPYTAFARIASMAALMAQFVDGVRNVGSSGFVDTAKQRQEAQGTGTVFGDVHAKSESILNAVQITADATTALVGINRGMLNALRSLQSGLDSASEKLARGAGQADFSGMNLAVGTRYPLGAPSAIVDPLNLFGGSSKITDQGIIIFGGALRDMLENIAVGAYQEVQSRSWLFGSLHTREGIKDVTDQFGRQFEMILSSISDTVRQGALALGMLPKQVEDALASYRIEEIRISLKDLSAEDQQKELQAVFSQIFDGLAGSIVPFIDQFQKIGEGLGETLVRVATGVQVTQEAVRYLGLAVDQTDPERLAQISESLLGFTGGIDNLISGMTSFVEKFAPEQHRFAIAADALASAFDQVDLSIPSTRDQLWALMQSLDATTDAGREQIATLLRLADVADQYYTVLEKVVSSQLDYISKVSALETELKLGGGFNGARAEITRWATETSRALENAARAAGRAGAAERDLALVRDVAHQRLEQLTARLRSEAEDLAVQIGLRPAVDTIDSLDRAIAALRDSSAATADGITDAVTTIRDQMGLLLGDLSPFNDRTKLDLARQGLMAGTVTQEQFLEIARRLFGSTSRYAQEFDFAQRYPGISAQDRATAVTAPVSQDNRSLEELLAARDTLMAAQTQSIGRELASRIAELFYASHDGLNPFDSFDAVARSLGFDLADLSDKLGMSSDQMNGYLDALVHQFEMADFSAVGDQISDAVKDGCDRIIAAIEGRSITADAETVTPIVTVSMPAAGGNRVIEPQDDIATLATILRGVQADIAAIRDSSRLTADATEATVEQLEEVATATTETAQQISVVYRNARAAPTDYRGREVLR